MKPDPKALAARWRRGAAALAAGALTTALLVACGGGGDGGASGFGGGATAQSFTTGPISGLGSIIVGGVRFEDSAARVEDEDGASRSRSELKLGMMVEVQASSIDDSAARANASLVRFGSELKGPVAALNAAAQTITMLDQTVVVRAETVFDPALAGGFAALAVGQILEVHAQFDAATGRYAATRIELEDGAREYRLRGLVSALDTTAKTFKIGAATINYASVASDQLPAAFANGQRVRVRLQTAKVNDQWVAISVRTGVRRVDDFGDARLMGLVTDFVSPQQFSVQGVPVNATNAVFEPNAAAVVAGALVQVRGAASNGTIVATRVKVLDMRGDDWMRVELHGTVSGLNTTAKTFLLREVTVDYSRVAEWRDGAEANLADGRAVEVKGAWSADRRTLVAARIEFE